MICLFNIQWEEPPLESHFFYCVCLESWLDLEEKGWNWIFIFQREPREPLNHWKIKCCVYSLGFGWISRKTIGFWRGYRKNWWTIRKKVNRKHPPGKTPCKRISEFQQGFQEPTPVSGFGMMDTLILPTFEVYLLNLVPSHFPAYWLSPTIFHKPIYKDPC